MNSACFNSARFLDLLEKGTPVSVAIRRLGRFGGVRKEDGAVGRCATGEGATVESIGLDGGATLVGMDFGLVAFLGRGSAAGETDEPNAGGRPRASSFAIKAPDTFGLPDFVGSLLVIM